MNTEFYSVLRGHSFMTACCVVIDGNGRGFRGGGGHDFSRLRREILARGVTIPLEIEQALAADYPELKRIYVRPQHGEA